MSAVLAFLGSPLGRWAAGAAVALALVVGGLYWHGRAVDALVARTVAERDAAWQARLAAAEAKARRGVREREEAAYRAGVAEAEARHAADAAETETAVQVVKEVVRVSPSARDCTYDAATAERLNELRRGR